MNVTAVREPQRRIEPGPLTRAANRYAGTIKGLSVAVIVVALFVMARALPVDRSVAALKGWVEGYGALGPVVYGVAYTVAALLFVPGSALTLAAGAVFGLLWGAVTVSIAATTAAALAFLIARYVARGMVEAKARAYPRFAAIDRAIGLGGAKIVGLLRLSPAVPFSLSNYLFGLTAVRFWPYVLASWLCMLPGTFMYVYLGYAARAGLASAAAERTGRSVGEWALLALGLVATIAVTVYVTRLARRALRERTEIEPASAMEQPAADQREAVVHATQGWPWGATGLALLAVAMLAAAACVHWQKSAIRALFGPAPVTLAEAYKDKLGGPTFDHSVYHALLKEHVDDDGWVDYAALKSDPAKLDGYIESVAKAPFDALGRDEKLALLINAYNAFTLRLILDYYPLDSIRDIPASKRWDDKRWNIAGTTYTLNEIEHEQIRPKFVEPRIHFALVCAAIGCPVLRNEAYAGERIDEQLEAQARYVHSHDRWFRFEPEPNVVHLTKLYDWYAGDFEQVKGSILDYAAHYSPALKRALASGKKPQIRWLDYDWTLNDERNRP